MPRETKAAMEQRLRNEISAELGVLDEGEVVPIPHVEMPANTPFRGNNPRVLAIDPGDVHCGMAWFYNGKCRNTAELAPWHCMNQVEADLDSKAIDVLVIEEFRLYPWKAKDQAFSQFKTVEVIGVVRWLWAIKGWTAEGGVELVEQGASIKVPTRNILKAKKVVSKAKQQNTGGHCADAELHGYFYLMNRKTPINPETRSK